MISGVWGKKIGMSQLFDGDKVVPVTAVDFSRWLIVGVKTKDCDGYDAVCVGLLRKRFYDTSFSFNWLKKIGTYFVCVREVKSSTAVEKAKIGHMVPVDMLSVGAAVDVTGITRGRGYQGTVKRHGFTGGRASHGSAMGERRSGAIGWMRRQGRIIKGKRMAGHMGVEQRTMQSLQVMSVEETQRVVFIKGSIPGHSGSLVFIRKK